MKKLILSILMAAELALFASSPVIAEPEIPIIQREFERVVNRVNFMPSDASNIKNRVMSRLNSKDKKIIKMLSLQTIRNLVDSACYNNQSFGFYAYKGELRLEKGQTYANRWAYLVTSQELSNPYPVEYRSALPAIYNYVIANYSKCVYSPNS
ncbi:hypothetical protein RIVM261_078120 [Rivularia sp. IAM M-261]|nr:hypothetical protein RIVM261_078120 [Rivularia sp. IAM M-261]